MKYRSDIDGLRAVAVLPVVAFHLGFLRIVPGGFVGVDVFFVISGFLITKIIYDEVSVGAYSVWDFYARRVKRIFPALYAVFAFIVIASLFFQFPSETEDIGKSILSSVFFVSNVLFFFSSGYFDQKMEFNPLLHTWSLSVEEQFYIVFPIVVFVLRNSGEALRKKVIYSLALLSFVAAEVAARHEPMAAFYLVFFRAWELLLGTLIAIGAVPTVRKVWVSEAVAGLGLVCIFLGTQVISKGSVFPGSGALLPCIGAGAVIYSGGGTFVARLLSLRPIRFVGLISYSLYIWHWPIIVFANIYRAPNGSYEKLFVFCLCLLVAWLSWRFIEQPFRNGRRDDAPRLTVFRAVLCMACFGFIGLFLGGVARYVSDVPQAAEEMLRYEGYDASKVMRVGSCFLTSGYNNFSYFDSTTCLKSMPGERNVLIVGDSHAAHLWYGFSTAYPDINFMQATASGCKPVMNTRGETRCTDLVRFVFNDFLPKHSVDAVVLSGRWGMEDVDAVVNTASILRKYVKRVVISGPIVEYDQSLPRVVAKAISLGTDLDTFAATHRRAAQRDIDTAFRAHILADGVSYESAYGALCSSSCVLTSDNGVPVQFDYGHLTAEGSVYLAKKASFVTQIAN